MSVSSQNASPNRVVLKFGGTSVADLDRIRNVAEFVKIEADRGNAVVVVVSAMAGETNRLVDLVNRVEERHNSADHDRREYDDQRQRLPTKPGS